MEQLTGKLVAISPALANDPIFKQGQIGIIAMADLKSGTANVVFSSGELGRYSSDALLVLKDKRHLYQDIMTGVREMDGDTFRQLLDINMKQEHADYLHQSAAMKIALSNPEVLKHSTVSLEEHLSIDLGKDINHDKVFER